MPHDGKAVCYESKFIYDPLQKWNEGSTLSHDLDGIRPPYTVHNPLFRLPIKTTDQTNGKFLPIAPYAVYCCWILASRAPREDKYRVITSQSSSREVRGGGWLEGWISISTLNSRLSTTIGVIRVRLNPRRVTALSVRTRGGGQPWVRRGKQDRDGGGRAGQDQKRVLRLQKAEEGQTSSPPVSKGWLARADAYSKT